MSEERARFEQRIGSLIGGYVLEAVIGSGGMGVVYRARAADSGRIVAMKLMLPEVASNRKFRERFILEAQVAPQLDHPHIVPIFEVGESGGELFIAMRLVDGLDLKELIEREGPIEPGRALRLLRQAAHALDHAHERGVVHRDVKPQNLLIAKSQDQDHLYLTDFGLVKPTSSESTASRTTDVFGSIQYMSPEQIEDLPTDGRADVYSLACVFFECLTGKPPFERSNEVALLWAHVHEEPPRATDLQGSIPSGVDLVLRQAMSKHPDDRYLTCGEFAEAVDEGMKQHRRQLVAPVMRPLVKRIPRPKTEREVWAPNFFPEVSRIRKLTDKPKWAQAVAIVVLGSLIAATALQIAHPRGLTGAVAEGVGAVTQTVEEAGEAIASALEPSSDQRASAKAAGAVRRIPPRSPGQKDVAGASQVLGRPPGGSGLVGRGAGSTFVASSEEKSFIAFASDREGTFDIWRAGAGGRDVRQLTSGNGVDLDPAVSPDGRKVVFSRGSAVRAPCMTVVGHRQCVGNSGHLWLMSSDGTGLTQLTTGANTYDAEPDWAPDGRSLVFTRWEGDRNPKLYVMELDKGLGQDARPLIASNDGEMEPSFSADGRRVVYSRFGDDDRTWEPSDNHSTELGIAELSIGASGYTLVAVNDPTLGGGGEAEPAWAPNGRDIVFARPTGLWAPRRPGLWIWRCSASGAPGVGDACAGSDANRAQRLTQGSDWAPTWSPDSSHIAFQRCDAEEKCRILTLELDEARIRTLIDHPGVFDGLPDWGAIR